MLLKLDYRAFSESLKSAGVTNTGVAGGVDTVALACPVCNPITIMPIGVAGLPRSRFQIEL